MSKKAQNNSKEDMATRLDIQKQFEEVSAEIELKEMKLERAKSLASDARRAVDFFKRDVAERLKTSSMHIDMNKDNMKLSAVGEFKEDRMNEEEKEKFSELQQSIAAHDAEIATITAELESLQQQRKALLAELSDIGDPLKEILFFQENLEAAEQSVDRLRAAICTQENVIRRAGVDSKSMGTLLQSRQDLLADIAIGISNEKHLEEIDKQIEATGQKFAKANDTAEADRETARQTILGLQRKLAEAEEHLNALQNMKNSLIVGFLRHEAEVVGKEYVDVALKAISSYRRLIALDRIMTGKNQGAGILSRFNDEIALPVVDLNACAGLEDERFPGVIFESIKNNHSGFSEVNDAVEAELHRIKSLGVFL